MESLSFAKSIFMRLFILFLALLLALNFSSFVISLTNGLKDSETLPTQEMFVSVENAFNEQFFKKSSFVDFHGALQRLLLKNEVGNFDVIRDDNHFLHRPYASPSPEAMQGYLDNISTFYAAVQERQIPYLYIQAPSDILQDEGQLPQGLHYASNHDLDTFLSGLAERNIPHLDTRLLFEGLAQEDIFFRTDHHWSLNAAFTTFSNAITVINETHGLNIDPEGHYRNIDNYTIQVYDDQFLGSFGIRTGEYYVGRDDFIVYYPNEETNFSFTHTMNGLVTTSQQGPFETALVDQSRLTEGYDNSYNAFLYGGTVETEITNHLATNDLKCLVISDSFSRSMVPYLSLCFSQVSYIDPQEGRYNESYIEYLDTFQPDVVLHLINGRSIYIPLTL